MSPEVSLRHRLELDAGGECTMPALYSLADLAGTVTRLTSRSPPAQPLPAVAFHCPLTARCPGWGCQQPRSHPSTAPLEIKEAPAVPLLGIISILPEITLLLQKKPFSPYSTAFGGTLISEIARDLAAAGKQCRIKCPVLNDL